MISGLGLGNLFEKDQALVGLEIGCSTGDTAEHLLETYPQLNTSYYRSLHGLFRLERQLSARTRKSVQTHSLEVFQVWRKIHTSQDVLRFDC